MLGKNSAFESNFNRKDNLTPSFEDAHDLKNAFFQEETGGLFSAPKFDFTALEEYGETDEYNFEDPVDLFRDNHPLPALNYSNFQESIDGNFSDIIGDIAISGDRDSLLNSELNPEQLLSGEGDLERGKGIMGVEKIALIPALLKNSELSLEDLPVGARDFQSIDRTASEGKAFSNLNDLALDFEDLPFSQANKKLDITPENNIPKAKKK